MSEVSIAIFGKRGFAFEIPDDEFENVQLHIDTLIRAAHGVNHLITRADPEDIHSTEYHAAMVGATFIASMATELTERLRQVESDSTAAKRKGARS
jgi:hypothetical protein